ncbi:MAG: hypothetical protein ACRES4_08250 [Nevskiales bacterium]
MPNTIIRAMGEILLLRGGPQNLPTSYSLLAVVTVFFVAGSTALFRLQGMTGVVSLLQALVSFAVLAGYLHTLLRLRNFGNRLPQTLTALVITACVFSLLAWWPISILLPHMQQIRAGTEVQAPIGPTLFVLMLGAWSLAVQSHILKVAMEIRMMAAFGLVLLYELLSVLVVNLLFGQAAAPVTGT